MNKLKHFYYRIMAIFISRYSDFICGWCGKHIAICHEKEELK